MEFSAFYIKGKEKLTEPLVTELAPKSAIPTKYITRELSIIETEERKSKIDQVESRSISCAGTKRSYADISRFCAIMNYISSVKISIAIDLIKEDMPVSTTSETSEKNKLTNHLNGESQSHFFIKFRIRRH